MKKKIWTVAEGGYKSVQVSVYTSHEKAFEALREEFEEIKSQWSNLHEGETYLEPMSAQVYSEDMGCDDAWTAEIQEHEIEIDVPADEGRPDIKDIDFEAEFKKFSSNHPYYDGDETLGMFIGKLLGYDYEEVDDLINAFRNGRVEDYLSYIEDNLEARKFLYNNGYLGEDEITLNFFDHDGINVYQQAYEDIEDAVVAWLNVEPGLVEGLKEEPFSADNISIYYDSSLYGFNSEEFLWKDSDGNAGSDYEGDIEEVKELVEKALRHQKYITIIEKELEGNPLTKEEKEELIGSEDFFHDIDLMFDVGGSYKDELPEDCLGIDLYEDAEDLGLAFEGSDLWEEDDTADSFGLFLLQAHKDGNECGMSALYELSSDRIIMAS